MEINLKTILDNTEKMIIDWILALEDKLLTDISESEKENIHKRLHDLRECLLSTKEIKKDINNNYTIKPVEVKLC